MTFIIYDLGLSIIVLLQVQFSIMANNWKTFSSPQMIVEHLIVS